MRAEINKNTELGQKLSMINKGIIAPPELTIQCIKQYVTNPEYKFVILDGFPRSIVQLEIYNQVVGPADLTIILTCPQDVCTQRLHHRALTSTRVDDHDESIIAKRFNSYQELTVPAEEYVKQHGDLMNFKIIDANRPLEEVYQSISEAIDETVNRK